MDSQNIQVPMSKPLSNQPVYCPWTSKAPFTSTIGMKNGQSEMVCHNGLSSSCGNLTTAQIVNANNGQQVSANKFLNMPRQETPIQQSSSQFFHFLRLMQLFPEVHPATLHTVMSLCQNNFFAAVDKLLYAKKCKEVYNSRKSLYQRYEGNRMQQQMQRHQPYCCTYNRNGQVSTNNGINSNNLNNNTNSNSNNYNQTIVLTSVNTNNGMQVQQNNKNGGGIGMESQQQQQLLSKPETKKIIIRNRMRKDKSPSPQKPENKTITIGQPGDLQPVASPHCKLPINPLSPLAPAQTAEDLSATKETSSMATTNVITSQ